MAWHSWKGAAIRKDEAKREVDRQAVVAGMVNEGLRSIPALVANYTAAVLQKADRKATSAKETVSSDQCPRT
jgi:hypothetical protein